MDILRIICIIKIKKIDKITSETKIAVEWE